MKPGRIRTALLTAGCLLAAGCSLLAPLPNRARFFTLTPMPEAQARRAAASTPDNNASEGILYGLGPVKLAPYLDRNEVATRVSPTEVRYSPVDRWAEPLTAAITSVLQQNLSALLDTDRIVAYPWVGALQIDYQVEVGVPRFETDATGTSQLTARWGIRDVRHARYVVIKESTFVHPGQPGNATASATDLSATLDDLSREIATALRPLPLPTPEPTPAPRHKRK